MKFKEAMEIVMCLADQGSLANNRQAQDDHRDEHRDELDRQNEAFGLVSDFMQNCDLSEFDACEPGGKRS